MRKRLFILSAFMLAVMFASSQGTSTIVSFYSKSLHCKKQAVIYLPPGYADNDSVGYPVVYFLHGAGGNHESYEFIAKIVDELIFEKKIKPVIIVKPDASCPPYESSMYSNSTLYGNYEDFIVKDIISFTDSAYRTLKSVYFRAVMGHSMGGYGALKLGLKYPETFGAVASLSGCPDFSKFSLWLPDILKEAGGKPPYRFSPANDKPNTNLMFTIAGGLSPNPSKKPYCVDFPISQYGKFIPKIMDKWREEDPVFLAKIMLPDDLPAIYFDCGTIDEFHFLEFNRGFDDSLKQLGLPHRFVAYQGNHSNKLDTRLAVSFSFIDSVFNEHRYLVDPKTHDLRTLYLSDIYSPTGFPRIKLSYFCSDTCRASIIIYDLTGSYIFAPVDNERLSPGLNSLSFSKIVTGPGLFYCMLISEKKKFIRKFAVIE